MPITKCSTNNSFSFKSNSKLRSNVGVFGLESIPLSYTSAFSFPNKFKKTLQL